LRNPDNLTSGRLLARNTVINLAGEVAPFLLAVVAIPVLIHGIGVDRYGVLTLVVLAVGYFGVFNFGLGNAATKFIAESAASGTRADVPGLFWTALFLMFGFGLCGTILLTALSPWLVSSVLKIAPDLQSESLHAFYMLALSLPFVISGGSLSGTLSAYQRFDLINAVRVPSGILYYLLPLVALTFSHDLGWIVAAIVLVRVASWAANFTLCLHVLPELRHAILPRRALVSRMLSFGGWITISAILVQIMEYADRFLIGAFLSVASVTYYATPYQVTNKLRIIPGALSAVAFPALSTSFIEDPRRAAILYERTTRYIMLALFPLVLIIVTLAPEGLTLWLGPIFAHHSTSVLRWLTLGIFVNSISWTPHVFLPAADRPDLTAKLNLVELPAFLLLLWWILPRYNVAGAAAAFAVRSAADTLMMLVLAHRCLPDLARLSARLVRIALLLLLVVVLGIVPMALSTKGVFLTATMGVYGLVCWAVLLEPAEREYVLGYLRAARFAVIDTGQ
jgi:O-antigen/teichoic acid export membrane protein